MSNVEELKVKLRERIQEVLQTSILLFITLSTAGAQDLHEWKGKAGHTTKAAFLKVDESTRKVKILIPKEIDFDKLDDDSIALARKLASVSIKAKVVLPPAKNGSTDLRFLREKYDALEGMIEKVLDEYFRDFESNTLDDGRPRRMSRNSDNMALFESIGDSNSPDSVTLIIGLPNDAPKVLIRNSAMVLRFVKNALPNWSDSTDWVSSTLDTLNQRMDGKPISKTVDGAEISITIFHILSMCTVTIKSR